ncbi:MAG TPA: putative sugar O-methyltransferase [Pyrinomonadaceae bacterium]|nr:putative sugar O-methyltransferase [Pyrinomonadaceae bacterium]
MFANVISRIGYKLGLTPYNVYLLKGFKRPEWLYRNRKSIPFHPLYFSPVSEVTAEDIALAGRLLAAYAKATATGAPTSESISKIWTAMLARYGKLFSALEQGEPEGLAKTLSSMFREGFIVGVGTGDTYPGSQTRIGARIWSQRYLEDLVSLAEYVGVVRTECVEQGSIGWAFKDGVEELVAKIEAAIGMPIGFPNIGAPYGLKIGDALITFEGSEHIYVALRISEAIDSHLRQERAAEPHIVEIGAGFGGTAHWLLKLRRRVGSYTIIDLPIVNVLQGYFLAKAFGAQNVSLFGEEALARTSSININVRPTHALDSIGTDGVDVLVNENSMPEMPQTAVENYLTWAKEKVGGIFYSYNQEAYSPYENVLQVLVPEVVARVGGFKRLSRNYSWVRRGYVEEIYLSDKVSRQRFGETG